jgi:RNA polymerase sigma-70 factor (ECF subfamily)
MTRAATDEERDRFRQDVLPHLAEGYALARWLAGNRADADDILQDACLRALRGIGGFGGVNARAWTLTIVRNAAYSWLRKNRSATIVMVDDLAATDREQSSHPAPGQTMETPEALLIAKTEAARLTQAIADLPIPFREALVLRDVQGLGYRDIAEITGVPIGTVMSRLARARAKLIAVLGKDAP